MIANRMCEGVNFNRLQTLLLLCLVTLNPALCSNKLLQINYY